jgi:hypothetical protein
MSPYYVASSVAGVLVTLVLGSLATSKAERNANSYFGNPLEKLGGFIMRVIFGVMIGVIGGFIASRTVFEGRF